MQVVKNVSQQGNGNIFSLLGGNQAKVVSVGGSQAKIVPVSGGPGAVMPTQFILQHAPPSSLPSSPSSSASLQQPQTPIIVSSSQSTQKGAQNIQVSCLCCIFLNLFFFTGKESLKLAGAHRNVCVPLSFQIFFYLISSQQNPQCCLPVEKNKKKRNFFSR